MASSDRGCLDVCRIRGLHTDSRTVNLEESRNKPDRSPFTDLAEVAGCCRPLSEERIPAETAALLAPAFKALGDPVRLQLMPMIASAPAGEIYVCDLTPGSSCPGRRSPAI